MKLFQTVRERFVVASNAVQSLEARVGWRHTLAHHFDYRVGAGNLDIFFAAPGRAGCSDVGITKKSRDEYGGAADTPRNLPCETRSRGRAGNISLRVDRHTINRSGGWMHDDIFDMIVPRHLFGSI